MALACEQHITILSSMPRNLYLKKLCHGKLGQKNCLALSISTARRSIFMARVLASHATQIVHNIVNKLRSTIILQGCLTLCIMCPPMLHQLCACLNQTNWEGLNTYWQRQPMRHVNLTLKPRPCHKVFTSPTNKLTLTLLQGSQVRSGSRAPHCELSLVSRIPKK